MLLTCNGVPPVEATPRDLENMTNHLDFLRLKILFTVKNLYQGNKKINVYREFDKKRQ